MSGRAKHYSKISKTLEPLCRGIAMSRDIRWISLSAIAVTVILLLAAFVIIHPITNDTSTRSANSSVVSDGTTSGIVAAASTVTTTATRFSNFTTTVTTTSTFRTTRVVTPPGGNGTLVSTLSPNGIMLLAAVNASSLTVGQSLQFNVSLFNTLSTVNSTPVSHNWLFQGIPIALWGNCAVNAGAPAPVEVDVFQGYYALQNLSSATKNVFVPSSQGCHESTSVSQVTFWPASSLANLTLVVNQKNVTSGPREITDQYTTRGYWNLTYNMTPNDRNPEVHCFHNLWKRS